MTFRLAMTSWLVAWLAAPGHASQAAHEDYLPDVPAYLGSWVPEDLHNRAYWPADFVVAQDGSGTHLNIQSAIDDLPPVNSDSARKFVLIKDGIYRETVCALGKVPFTLYAKGHAHAVTVVQSRYNAMRKPLGQAANPCVPALQDNTYGTFGSASVSIYSNGVHLAGFTIQNDAMDNVRDGLGYPEGSGESGGAQAVALALRGDQMQLSEMRLLGHQDTFFVDKTPPPLGRVHVSDSVIAGDVDFIFGGARLVIDKSLIVSRAGRRTPGTGGHVLAPSTAANEPYGFLVKRSSFLGQKGLAAGSIHLGRPWDAGVKRGEWIAMQSPNGQALIRDSQFGEHLNGWGASTSGRPPDATGAGAFRLSAFRNEQVKSFAPVDLP